MRNIINIGHHELLRIVNGKPKAAQFITDWCDKNVSAYEVKTFPVFTRSGILKRYGIVFENEDDLLMFIVMFAGQFEALHDEGKFRLGPYTEAEMKRGGALPDL